MLSWFCSLSWKTCKMQGEDQRQKNYCSQVPSLESAFVETFVDYVVGKQFLHPQPSESHTSLDESNNSTQRDCIGLSENEEIKDGLDIPTRIPAPDRLIAIGDLQKAKRALLIAEVMDVKERWIGGRAVVVQDVKLLHSPTTTSSKWVERFCGKIRGDYQKLKDQDVGDILDRGGDEIKIIYLLEKLKREAQREGCDVHIMNGNHEVMNAEANFRFATSAGLTELKCWADWYKMGNVLKERCKGLEKPYHHKTRY